MKETFCPNYMEKKIKQNTIYAISAFAGGILFVLSSFIQGGGFILTELEHLWT